ncbi:hypothetical protein PF006_g13046 [Phytophthora fragariae]|uniref:Uncharacterized protein n=1 Tax=Phytophthora fragariae TaxID=53985 RepID=A0A6A3TSU2_9STRA|nr:hypothetical protein PF003_g33748 [Phytophthora fragariae]KAE9141795.1 hypothetical protein PF006_g13046 [Phytophthora fragariae]
MQSGLAPWQVVRALKTYVYPKVEYALRHLRPLQSQLQGFDRAVAKGLRHLLRLPRSATNEVLYAPTSSGGLGLQPLVDMHKALQVVHAWQMLHSKDTAVVAIAKTQVCQVACKRYRLQEEHWRGRDDELVRLFLNSELAASPHATRLRRNGDIGSLWSDVQRTLLVHHLALAVRDEADAHDPLGLRVPHHDKWLDHKSVLRHVKLHMKIRHQTRWKGLVDQGKTVRVHGGPGAKFVSTGAGLSDVDYRFGVKARLNQVDTNSALKRKHLRANAACRDPTCSGAETLAHVLNHCASKHGRHSPASRRRPGADRVQDPQRPRAHQVDRGAAPQPDGARVHGRSSAARHCPAERGHQEDGDCRLGGHVRGARGRRPSLLTAAQPRSQDAQVPTDRGRAAAQGVAGADRGDSVRVAGLGAAQQLQDLHGEVEAAQARGSTAGPSAVEPLHPHQPPHLGLALPTPPRRTTERQRLASAAWVWGGRHTSQARARR